MGPESFSVNSNILLNTWHLAKILKMFCAFIIHKIGQILCVGHHTVPGTGSGTRRQEHPSPPPQYSRHSAAGLERQQEDPSWL